LAEQENNSSITGVFLMTPEQELDPENWTNAVDLKERQLVKDAVEFGLVQLDLTTHVDVVRIRNAWIIIGYQFIHDGKLFRVLGNAKSEQKRLKRLAKTLAKAVDLIDDLTPEYWNALDGVAAGLQRHASMEAFRESLAVQQNDILEFLDCFEAVGNRHADYVLHEAMTALSGLLEGVTGVAPEAARNYHTERGHSLNTTTAEAIGAFCQTLRPSLSLPTLVYAFGQTEGDHVLAPSNLERLAQISRQIAIKAEFRK
jgi:hypothetical protein